MTNSKLPDLKELGKMTGKLFKDVKKSVSEIIDEYKKNRAPETESAAKTKPKKESATTEEKPQDNAKKDTKDTKKQ